MEKSLVKTEVEGKLTRNQGLGQNVQSINDTCKVHKGSRLIYFCLDSSQNSVFKCMYCITNQNINPLTLIPIEQILTADDQTVFDNFPLKDRDLTQQINEIVQNPPTSASLKQSIDAFFKELRMNFNDRACSIQEKMIEKAEKISDFADIFISNYNRVSSKQQLKSVFLDEQKPIEKKEVELKEIYERVHSKNEENYQLFTELVRQKKAFEQAIDFETPKLILTQIMQQLDSINIFRVDDIGHLQQQLLSLARQQQQEQKIQENSTISNLMKLVSNQFNDVSVEQCAKLENQLKRFSFIIDQLSVPVPGLVYQSLNSLNQEESNIFTGLIKEVASLKQQHLMEEEVENERQIQENNGISSQLEQLRADQIMEFVSNSTNFCSTEFIEDVSKVMTTIGGLLKLFRVRKSHNKSEKRGAFNGLNPKQLDDFAKLAAQVNLLTQNHGDLYLLSKLPIKEIQPNSFLLKNLIGKYLINRVILTEERRQRENDLYELLVQFPIAELLPPFQLFQPLPIVFTRTQYKHSSEMGITMNGNQVELTFPNCQGKMGQAVSQILKNESGYLLKLKFNRPYGKHVNGFFNIGLIPDSQMNSHFILQNHIKSGFSSHLKGGASASIRGDLLSSERLRNITSEIEFRWCISKRQFFISDSNYLNINQADPNLFNPDEIYRFGVFFYNFPEKDWKVTITDFWEIDPADVSKYQ